MIWNLIFLNVRKCVRRKKKKAYKFLDILLLIASEVLLLYQMLYLVIILVLVLILTLIQVEKNNINRYLRNKEIERN